MLKPNLHWVSAIAPYRLALMARPTGGEWLEQAVLDLRADKVDTVVSLLETPEVRELALQQEAALCQAHGIEFMAFPIPDRGTPHSKKAFSTLLEQLHAQLLQGRGVAIHCRAGIGRTGVLAACLLHMLDVPQRDLFRVLSKARGVTMPDTEAQIEWVAAFVRTKREASLPR